MSEVLDKEVLKNLSMEEMLSLDLEEIPELEEYELIPAGVYLFNVAPATFDSEDQDTKKHFIGVDLTVASVVELVDPALADAVKVGESKLAQRFYGSFGVQRFAKMFSGVTETLRAQGEKVSVVTLLESIGGRQIQATVTHRTAKLTKEQREAKEVAKVYGEVDPHTTVLIG